MGALFLSCESETGAGVLVGGGNGALVGYLGEGGSCTIIGAGVGAGIIVGGLIGATFCINAVASKYLLTFPYDWFLGCLIGLDSFCSTSELVAIRAYGFF